ncbi:hypothetical protein AB0D99_16535 [Streptomyces sp. NPDC047971]|uniref:hypothetical protein n=1 Tax=Streptomyces sp. NPDC047971 TaxID=3154499 RepID=UPI003408D9D1
MTTDASGADRVEAVRRVPLDSDRVGTELIMAADAEPRREPVTAIQGYDGSPLVAGEPWVARPGFWSNHLLVMCGDGSCTEQPSPEWFGDDGADADAMSEALFAPERWPVFRVPADHGPGAVVIYRNLDGAYGTDYLLTRPDGSGVRRIASWEQDFSGTGLSWHELVHLADNPSAADVGVRDTAARLLLLLPLLADPGLPDAATETLTAALTAVGSPGDTAATAAEHLLAHLERRSRHDPTWESPLSGAQKAAPPSPDAYRLPLDVGVCSACRPHERTEGAGRAEGAGRE